MKVYIAAPWEEKTKAASDAKFYLESEGFEVTSSWITRKEDKGNTLGAYKTDELTKEAVKDLEDIDRADAILLLNTQKRGQETSGKQVEFGYSIAHGKRLVVVGESSNVFHLLPGVVRATNLREAVDALRQ